MSSTFPFGVRFCPTDEELITCYLKNMVKNQPLPSGWDRVIIVRDIYGENEGATPWILFRDDDPWQTTVVDPLGKVLPGQKVIYVFTRLSNVGKTGEKNKNRIAGCGQWHGNTSQLIWKNGGTGELIGKKGTFTFRSEKETLGQWIMHEYDLDGASLAGVNSKDNYVLCKIKKDESKSSKGGRLVSRKNSTHSDVESNDHDGIGATAQCLEKRKLISEEGFGQCKNKKLRCDPIEETAEPDTTNSDGEQTDGSQLITSAVLDDRSSLNDQRKSMGKAGGGRCSDNGTHRPGIMDEGEKDIDYVSSDADRYFDIDELLALIENNPLNDAEQIDEFRNIMEFGDSSVADGAQNNETGLGDSFVVEGAQSMHVEGGTSGDGTDQSATLNDQEANIATTNNQGTLNDQEANIATTNNQGAVDNVVGDGDDYTSFDPNLVLGDDIYLTPPDDDYLKDFWEELCSNPSSLFDLNPSLLAKD